MFKSKFNYKSVMAVILLIAAVMFNPVSLLAAGPPAAGEVTIRLIDSNGNGITGGSASYYAGGWIPVPGTTDANGEITLEIDNLQNYTFKMKYEGATLDKQQDVSADSVVVFQTVAAAVELRNSTGNLMDTGSVKFYSDSWRTIGDTVNGRVVKELLPRSYTFKMIYEGGTQDIARDISADPVVVFQTAAATVELRNSSNNLMDTGSVKFYSDSWRTIGDTVNGRVVKELLPRSYTFKMIYEGGTQDIARDIGADPVVVFQTAAATVELRNSSNNLMDTGSVKFYSDSWRTIGDTVNGRVVKELLPLSYTFKMIYEGGTQDIARNIGTDPVVVFQTAAATVELRNSSNNLMDTGSVKFYSDSWRIIGDTVNGRVVKELLPRSYTFKMVYEGGTQDIARDIGADPMVVFQTAAATVELRNSSNNLMDTGTVKFYSDSWRTIGDTTNGRVVKELLPRSYTFKMIYEGGTQDIARNIGTDPVVVFQTAAATVELRNSSNNLMDTGTVKFYSDSWRTIGDTTNGRVVKELLPRSYTFKMIYEGGTQDIARNIGADPMVVFQTAAATVELRNSSNNLMDTGTVKFYSDSWRTIGNTTNGRVVKELLPRSYTFKMIYEGGSKDIARNIGTDPVVVFQTVAVTVELRNSSGNLMDTGTVKFYSDSWRTIGDTVNGRVQKELLPRSYTFQMIYDGSTENKAQDVGAQPVVVFSFQSGTETDPPVITVSSPEADAYLASAAITVTGTVTDQSTVSHVTVNGTDAQLTGGNFTCAVTLVEGENTLTIEAEDEFGNTGTASLQVVLDTVGPVITVSQPAPNSFINGIETLVSGDVADSSPVTLTVNGTAVNLPTSLFEISVSLVEGENRIKLIARDAAGNQSSHEMEVYVDTTAPGIEITTPADNSVTKSEKITITGTLNDNYPYKVTSDSTAAEMIGNHFYFRDVPLVEGENVFTLHAEDRAGNTVDKTYTVIRDTVQPALTLLAPINGMLTSERSLLVRGTVSDTRLKSVLVNNTTCQLVNDSEFNASIILMEGLNTISVTAEDFAGNTAAAAATVTVDTRAPVINIESPSAGQTIVSTSSITVSGRVDDIYLSSVSVNGTAVTLTDNRFNVADFTLQEGKNTITIEAGDTAGNKGVVSRIIYLDTQAPQVVNVSPPDGTTGIAVGVQLQVELSEVVDDTTLTNENVYLEDLNQQRVAGTVGRVGTMITLTPQPAWPDNAQLTLHVTGGVKDAAGNAIQNPYVGTFTTIDHTAPAAPSVTSIPTKTTSGSITLSGTAEPGSKITVTGGTLPQETTCDAAGVFNVAVPLNLNRLNQLTVTATDSARNTSLPLMLSVYQETVEFVVSDASLADTQIIIDFSSPVDETTLTPANFIVISGTGPVDGTITVSGDYMQGIFTASSSLASEMVKVDLTTAVKDRDGNKLLYPFTKMFNQQGGEVISQGEVYDDAVGLPLGGAVVTLISVDGAVVADPAPAVLTTSEGSYVLPIPAGLCILRISKEGYTMADRAVTAAPGFSARLFDARIRPMNAQEKTLTPSAGILVFNFDASRGDTLEKAILICPDNTVATDVTLRAAAVGPQSLQGRLPLGWSPLAALDIRAAASPQQGNLFNQTVTLRVPNQWPGITGASLVLARWDESFYTWMVQSMVSVSEGELSGTIDTGGQYAFLIKDDNAALANAVPGSPLPGLSSGSIPVGPDAALGFDPTEIFPGDTSGASLAIKSADGTAVIPSGVPIQATLSETYEFINQSKVGLRSYTVDLTAYNYRSSTAKVEFNLSPDRSISISDLKIGTIHTAMIRYNETLLGVVVDASGGEVTGDGGAKINIGAGALAQPTPVSIKKIELAQITMPVPEGFEALGAVDLSLSGARLSLPAVLSLELEQTVIDSLPADAQMLAVRLHKSDMGYAWLLQSLSAVENQEIKTTTGPGALSFPGVTEGGTYLFIRALSPLGFITGSVSFNGQPLSGALLTVNNHELTALSKQDYLQVGFLGDLEVAALSMVTRDSAKTAAALQTQGEIITVNLGITETGPTVVSLSPDTGAQDVPANGYITFNFSEPVNAATFNAQNVYIKEGPVTVEGLFTLSEDGTQGQFKPNRNFSSQAQVDVTVTLGLKDLQGNAASSVFYSYFIVQDTTPPEVDPSKISVQIPENGIVHITGEEGALGIGDTLVVFNPATGKAVSYTAQSLDAFDITIEAGLGDRLQLRVVDAADNETLLEEKPFVSADGASAILDDQAREFITKDGLGLKLEEGTFDGPVVVTLTPVTDPSQLAPEIDGLGRMSSINVNFGGVTPNKSFKLSIPKPDGVPTDTEIFAARVLDFMGSKKMMVVDSMSIKGDRIETNSPPWPGCTAEGIYTTMFNQSMQIGYISGLVTRPGMAVAAMDLIFIVPEYDFVMPYHIGMHSSGPIQVIDTVTGEVVVEQAVPEDLVEGQVYDFGMVSGDKEPPILIRSMGIKSLYFDVGTRQVISQGITVTPDAGGGSVNSVTIKGDPNTTVNTGDSGGKPGKVRVYKLSEQGLEELMTIEGAADGSFSNTVISAQAGDKVVITVEQAEIPPSQKFVLSFSEPVKGDEEGVVKLIEIDKEDGTEEELEVDTDLLDSQTQIVVTPAVKLKLDCSYRLELQELKDRSDNGSTIVFDFRTRKAEVIDSGTGMDQVYDTLLIGGYLYVADGYNGLKVWDVSNPSDMVLKTTYTNFVGRVRALTRYKDYLVVIGGGDFSMGFIKLLNIDNVEYIHQEKTLIVSDFVGNDSGLPAGYPCEVKILGDYAFIAIQGSGLMVVDITAMKEYTDGRARIGWYPESNIRDVAVYKRKNPTTGADQYIAVLLVNYYGIKVVDVTEPSILQNWQESEAIEKQVNIGGEKISSHILSGLQLVTDYWVDIDNDGRKGEDEDKDWEIDEDEKEKGCEITGDMEERVMVFFSEPIAGNLYIYDLSAPLDGDKFCSGIFTFENKDFAEAPRYYGSIDIHELGAIGDLLLDEKNRTLYLNDHDLGLVVLDVHLDDISSLTDREERMMATIKTSGKSHFGLVVDDELNMAYVGQQEKGIDAVMLGNPIIKLVYDVEIDETTKKLLAFKEVKKVAPSGIKDADNPVNPKTGEKFPDTIYAMAWLPGGVGKEVKTDLWSLNADGNYMVNWDTDVNTHIQDFGLSRMSDNIEMDEFNIFLSKPIKVTVQPDEELDASAEEGTKLLLSGDWIKINLSKSVSQVLTYLTEADCESVDDRKLSIRADIYDREENFKEGEDEKPNSPTNNPFVYSNVLVHSGEFFSSETDFHIPSRGFDFIFTRTYRSQSIYSSTLGWGWDHNYNKRLLELYSGDLIYFDGTGRRERFKAKKSGEKIIGYESPEGWFTELTKMQDGSFYHMYPDRTIEFFDALGKLIKIQDRNKNKMEFLYNLSGQLIAVVDTMGRIINFEYYPFDYKNTDEKEFKENAGRLKQIRDFVGRVAEFSYDENTGDLTKVDMNTGEMEGVLVKSRIKKYEYNKENNDLKLAHNLLKLTDPRGVSEYNGAPYLTVAYTSDDKAETQSFAGLTRSLDFAVGSGSTTVTDARGLSKIFTFQEDDRHREITIGGKTTKIDLNNHGLITTITFPEGNTITYEYFPANESQRRSAGNLEKVTSSGSDGSISTSYGYELYYNQMTTITDPKMSQTVIGRDSQGNIQAVTPPGLSPYVYEYYPPGEPKIYGVLHTITDPEGNVTEYEFYPESTPSGDGSQTPKYRDMNGSIGGYLKSVTVDKGGDDISTNYIYNKLGYLKETEDGEGVKTTYDYDNPFGLVSNLVQGATGSNDGQPAANLTTTFEYDANGNLEREISSTGITIDYIHDRLNRMTSKTYNGGTDVMEYGFTYDNNSNLEVLTYPDKIKKDTFTYNSRDLLETKTSGTGGDTSTSRIEYTDNGYIHYYYDGRQKKYTYVHDSHGRLKEIIDPLGNKSTYGYDDNSNVKTMEVLGVDGKTLKQGYDYDLANRVTHHKLIKDGGEIITGFGYNNASFLNSVTTPNQHTWDITPTGSGLTNIVTDPLGNMDAHNYDKRGWPKQLMEFESGGRTLANTMKHTVLGDSRFTGDSINRDYNYTYHPQKHLLDAVKDPEGGLVTYGYDGLNRVKSATRHIAYQGAVKQAVTNYKYHANGTLSQVIDDDNNITSYVYDTKDRVTDIFYPATPGSRHFGYNENDQVNFYRDLNGTVVTNTYDDASRLTYREITPGPGVEGSTFEDFDFDGVGRLIKAENDDSIVTFDYNTAGRLVTETQKIKDNVGNIIATYIVGYEYDDTGNRTKLTYPSTKVLIYTPDELDRIDTITSGTKKLVDYDYEGKAKVTSKKLNNETVVMASIFDDGRRPVSLTYNSGGNELFNQGMTWNLTDMKKTDSGLELSRKYDYDSAKRLRNEENKKDGLVVDSSEFILDDIENLTAVNSAKEGMYEQSLTSEHNERQQFTSVNYKQTVDNKTLSIHVEPSYDTNGNMTSFVHQYTYNYKNQLIRVVTGTGVIVDYKYDALGRRIEKIVSDPNGEFVTRYVHDGWQVIEERDQNDIVLRRYTYGNGIDERVEMEYRNAGGGFDTYIPMQDTIGNVIGIADGTGKIVEKYSYSAYGAPVFGYDAIPPKLESIYKDSSPEIILRFTEPVNPDTVQNSLKLNQEGNEIDITTQVSEDGREVTVTPSESMPDGMVEIYVGKSIEDKAGNESESELAEDFFYYREETMVVYDNSLPEVESIEKQDNAITLKYTERIDPNTVSESLEISKDGGKISGSLTQISETEVKFTADDVFEERQEYRIWVKSVLKDLSGKSINEFFHNFVVMNDDMLIYEKADPNRHGTSKIGNNYLFHGRTYEPEVGLYYYRHRYYLPRIGRFLQNDPMGYKDSMNMYQAFNQNPVNYVDPMGLEVDIVYFSAIKDEDREQAVEALRLVDWGYFLGSTGHSLWNVASLGTLEKVERQENLGTWGGVLQSTGSAGASISNTITFGLQDRIYYTQMEEGAGLKSIWKGTKQAVIDLTPIEEIKIIFDSDTSIGEKISAFSMTVSKIAGYVAGYKGIKSKVNRIKIRKRVLRNIAESQRARASSNFKNYARWDDIFQSVKNLDFSTLPDKGVFYSGPGNRKLALDFAKKNNATPIDFTLGGRYLESLNLYSDFSSSQADAIWASASEQYASGVSGRINLFVRGASPNRIFRTLEEPTLKLNLNVFHWRFWGY